MQFLQICVENFEIERQVFTQNWCIFNCTDYSHVFHNITLSVWVPNVQMFGTCIYSELLLSCTSCFTGVAGASVTSCFAGVAGMSPLTLSTPVTDIKLFRSLEFDLWSTFVTRNLRWAKEISLVFPHRWVRSFSGETAWAKTNSQNKMSEQTPTWTLLHFRASSFPITYRYV